MAIVGVIFIPGLVALALSLAAPGDPGRDCAIIMSQPEITYQDLAECAREGEEESHATE